MADTETITIFKVNAETQEAVKSVNDLRENIKTLKDNLGQLEIGSTEYKDTLEELKVNQTALKNAMYATTASLEDVTKAATGTGQSYNALVAKMAAMKEELRATDVSTESGMAHFKDLAASINTVNDQLKAMDEAQGNFQRNVGNYPGLAKTWSTAFDQLDKGLKSTTKGVGGLKDGFESLTKNPWMFAIGALIAAFLDLKDSMKENEQVMGAIQQAGMSLEPVLKLIRGVVEKIATILADLISKAGEFIQSNGIFDKVINGVVGVGNAIMKFVVAPFKGVAAAIAVFKEQGVSGLKDAAKAFADEMKTGVSFKSNYDAGAAIVSGITAGMKDSKPDAAAQAQNLGKELGQEVVTGFELSLNEIKELDIDTIAERYYKMLENMRKKREEEMVLWEQDQELANAMVDEAIEGIRREDEAQAQSAADKAAALNKAMAVTVMYGKAVAGVLGNIADLYEQDEEHAAQNAEKIKGMRIAEATINTVTGAIGAFMQASSTLPPPFGQILGAITAASVTAAGVAQIAQIRKTDATGRGGVAAPVASMSASVSAPSIGTNIPQVRNVTMASEEERLNQMAGDQRVYILASDIEASNEQRRVQVAETSF